MCTCLQNFKVTCVYVLCSCVSCTWCACRDAGVLYLCVSVVYVCGVRWVCACECVRGSYVRHMFVNMQTSNRTETPATAMALMLMIAGNRSPEAIVGSHAFTKVGTYAATGAGSNRNSRGISAIGRQRRHRENAAVKRTFDNSRTVGRGVNSSRIAIVTGTVDGRQHGVGAIPCACDALHRKKLQQSAAVCGDGHAAAVAHTRTCHVRHGFTGFTNAVATHRHRQHHRNNRIIPE